MVYNRGTFFERQALHAVDMTLPAGAVTAVVGATASGKTTLLQLLAGLVPANEGQVEILGRPEALPGEVGMVMQRAEVQLFCATVREDVAVAPRLAGLEGRALDLRVEEAMDAVGLDLDVFGTRSPHALSLGEQRRVALAGILSLSPRVLILDEPGAGLDPLMRGRLMKELVDWSDEGGRTLLYASHDLEDVARTADYVILLAGGEVVAQGSTRDVLGDAGAMRASGMGIPLAARIAANLAESRSGEGMGTEMLPVTGSDLAEWLGHLVRVSAEAASRDSG